MTPEEKAKELFNKFRTEILSFLGDKMKDKNAKRCALIAVDELIKIHYLLTTTHDTSPSINYWKDVKQELEKL
jgi:4-alpha-glucanotransferase